MEPPINIAQKYAIQIRVFVIGIASCRIESNLENSAHCYNCFFEHSDQPIITKPSLGILYSEMLPNGEVAFHLAF